MSNSRAVVRPRLAAIVLFAIFFVSLSIHSVLQPNNFPESEVLVHDLPKKESPRPSHISGDPATDYGDYAFVPSSLVSHFPAPDPKRKDYHEWNAQSLRELHVCMALQLCGQNQRKIALLAAHWFEEAIVREWRGGEGVWCVCTFIESDPSLPEHGIRQNSLRRSDTDFEVYLGVYLSISISRH